MLQCGFYEKEITPPLGSHIPGYFNLRQGSDVKDRLYARAIAVKNEEKTVVIISIDGCDLNLACTKAISDRVVKFLGIPASNVLIAYTHTHTGIPTWNYEEEKNADADAIKSQEGYFTVFTKLIADCGILACYRMQESEMEFARGEVDGISFCRNFYMKNSTPATNPTRQSPDIEGPTAEIDKELSVLFVRGSAGEPMGAIINFACHPDTIGGTEYSGDYISELAKQMKKSYGAEFVTVFLQGTSGNINHFDVTKASDPPDHYQKMGRAIAGETMKALTRSEPITCSCLEAKLEWIKIKPRAVSTEKIAEAERVIATVKPAVGVTIAADNTDYDQYNLAMSNILMDFVRSAPEAYDVPLQFIRIGELEIYAFPSEIFCDFGMMVKKGAAADKCMVASMCNAAFGYVPTREMIYDTIYEARIGSNKFEASGGYMMAEKLIEMGK